MTQTWPYVKIHAGGPMEFFAAAAARRSVRQYTNKSVPAEVMEKALATAVIAPNSSNTQTWDFYWVQSPESKAKLVTACMSQSAARTAAELVVVTATPKNWKRSQGPLIQFLDEIKAPAPVYDYYKKLVPIMYTAGWFNAFAPLKWIMTQVTGLFRAMPRGPYTLGGIETVCIKSAALAAENFVLAISAQGFATCMMEGFDESRVKRLLGLGCGTRVVMVISVGEADAKGIWGRQFRISPDQVIHKV